MKVFRFPSFLALLTCSLAHAGEVRVAVAANFAAPMQAIAAILEKTTGHKAEVVTGATGKFYAQIKNGAPFDVLLSADNETPEKLEKDGLTAPGSRFTYARGQLVLWSANAALVDAQGQVLKTGNFRKLAIAQPKVAPYGAAAVQAITQLKLSERLTPRLVYGESLGQTFTFVSTGNAELGFVAMSQVLEGGKLKSGSMWVVPPSLYQPIVQDAVVLTQGKDKPAAAALVTLLKSDRIKDLIRSHGYEL
ncbi:MAG TPA: molybdate ABC transporter substrate-binding protein [Polaromonas sp.]|uniref:molybdate ABC transporter substrate-binding protein n=1 Tax=Polaromonas sp. TaxID=1869339 RepID=UPI002D724635|nr:molybdate ABC transporter substrate-binding protein [Polaromonas sp.]HYW56476.1 molybdate ABC transporter substrate-binding protein [Polaromonas sp.]